MKSDTSSRWPMADFYLEELRHRPAHQQLILKMGGALFEDKTEFTALIEALKFLSQNGVKVILVHGGGPQLSRELESKNIKSSFVDGKRVTDTSVINLADNVFGKLSQDLVEALNTSGVRAKALAGSAIATGEQSATLGYVAEKLDGIDKGKLVNELNGAQVLVISSLAREGKRRTSNKSEIPDKNVALSSISEENRTILNINADTLFRAIIASLRPHRLVSLTGTGGVLKDVNDSASIISGIDTSDVESLIQDGTISAGMAIKIREIAAVVQDLETSSAISITKPSRLLDELLTPQGSGTFVANGSPIATHTTFDGLEANVRELVQDAFGKTLPEGYFEQKIDRLYITRDHSAAAIILRLANNQPYLDKLVVRQSSRGRGIGEKIWYRIIRDYPKIVWRSHLQNSYVEWYEHQATTYIDTTEWRVFSHGFSKNELATLVDEIVAIPPMKTP